MTSVALSTVGQIKFSIVIPLYLGPEIIEGAPTWFTGSGPKLSSSLGVYTMTFSEMTWVLVII